MCEVVWWKKRKRQRMPTVTASSGRSSILQLLEEKRQSSFERIRFLLTLYQKIKDFSVTNLSAAEVTYLGTLLFRGGFQDAGILSIKGEASMGETYAEFHVDEQAMYEMVLEVFYRKAGKDHEK